MITYRLLGKQLMIFLFCVFSMSMFGQDLDAGKALFRAKCGSCHNGNMTAKMTGPPLGGAEENWADYPEDLYAWIANSQALVDAGHPRAVEIYNEYDGSVMTAFPELSREDIDNILAFIDGKWKGTYGAPLSVVGPSDPQPTGTPNYLYYLLFGLLAVLAIILTRVISNLNYMARKKDGEEPGRRPNLMESIFSKKMISFLIFGLILALGYMTVNNAISLGRQEGYAPKQPIAFSHEIHAGINQIDCQYCHDGARRSKHSIIPATNTCMNCHTAVTVGTETGTSEITKIFASNGFDPNTGKYIDGYETMDPEELSKVYKKWIGDQYILDQGLEELDNSGKKEVVRQWENIVSSLTNNEKKDFRGPIEWIRIHNLPDHVYFNHAQHVTVGELECQTCHGPVEEMDVLAQHAPLSMGWCVNCHRETDVKFTNNEYYASYQSYHDELASGDRKSVKVEEIGGLECQKCHY